MQKQTIRAASVCVLVFALGCSGSATKTSTPTTPTAPTIAINAPMPASPSDGTSAVGWPTLTVNNATHTGPVGPISYRFDVSTASDFTNIITTALVQEGSGQTSFTPQVLPLPADQATLYWRAVAIDSQNAVQSPPSTTQTFKENNPPTKAAQIAQQQGRTLWSGAVPPGTPGQARMGNGWEVVNRVSFDGVAFLSPELDELQWFDCVDRGMTPQGALDWMRSNGYATQALFYPDTGSGIPVVGFSHQYIALQGGIWELVTRVGA
jgi:hypothetical protein